MRVHKPAQPLNILHRPSLAITGRRFTVCLKRLEIAGQGQPFPIQPHGPAIGDQLAFGERFRGFRAAGATRFFFRSMPLIAAFRISHARCIAWLKLSAG